MKQSMQKAAASGLSALLLMVLLAAGCGREATETAKAPLVKTQVVGEAGSAAADSYPGTVKGRYETNLSFQVGGRILSRSVQQGSRVHAGDVLMTIDPRDAAQQANAGDAQVASARAQLDLAQANLSRYAQLYQENAVSAATLDQYQTNYDAAFAAYQSALAQAAQAHNSLGYTQLLANADGVISAVSAEAGQVVSAGQAVLTLVQTDELEVEINVPENRLAEAAVGSSATVTFWALPGSTAGTVREVSPMADSASRTYKVRLSLPEPPAAMQLGMTANVSFAGAAEKGFRLPLAAIYQTGERPQVWLVRDGKAELREVAVEDFSGNEVIVHGLAAGDRVVTAGVHKLAEGQAVRTDEEAGAAS